MPYYLSVFSVDRHYSEALEKAQTDRLANHRQLIEGTDRPPSLFIRTWTNSTHPVGEFCTSQGLCSISTAPGTDPDRNGQLATSLPKRGFQLRSAVPQHENGLES